MLCVLRYFDKDQNGKLELHEFKACLRSLGYDLPVLEQGQTDPEYESILDQVDPNRCPAILTILYSTYFFNLSSFSLPPSHSPSRVGFITSEDYMSFMISRETDNVRSITEVEGAFRAITARGDKPYVTKEDLLQVQSNS